MSSSSYTEPIPLQPNWWSHEFNTYIRQGRLIALRTKAEVQNEFETTDVYIVAIPLKSVSTILKTVDNAIREHESTNLKHLKRLVKPEQLPARLEPEEEGTCLTGAGIDRVYSTGSDERQDVDITSGCSSISDKRIVQHNEAPPQATLHFLACATRSIPYGRLRELLLSTGWFVTSGIQPHIRTVEVPVTPPTSHEQAKQLSQHYWPIVYKGGNPFGPHPARITRAVEEIQCHAGHYMGLAIRAGLATSVEGKGEPFGAVVVDRSHPTGDSILAVAGDARWEKVMERRPQRKGNVMAHAVMRVIGMVAKQRVTLSDAHKMLATSGGQTDFFVDEPLTALEKDFYSKSKLAPGGYLCLDLELYLTHEPCVMCSMAINHSRFGRVVFGQRMPRTGGLAADLEAGHGSPGAGASSKPGYGLWWCSQLNWKFLTWQWVDENPLETDRSYVDIQV